MSIRLTIGAVLIALSACATIENEQTEVKELPDGFYAGTQYLLRTQTVNGSQGQFERTSVVYKGRSRVCIKDSPRDCELAARALIDACESSFFCL